MKAYFKWMLIFVVIFAVAIPMLLKGPDGRPIMSIGDWLPAAADLGQLANRVKSGVGGEQSGQQVGGEQPNTGHRPSAAENNLQTLSRQQLADSPAQLSSTSGKMYKWQDKNGRWHFSSQKPLNQQKVQVQDLPDVENVIDAPVTGGDNSSTIGLPDFGDAGDLLKKVQRMAESRNN